MKIRMVQERIGENMGPIDWSYDFRQHFNGYSDAAYADEVCAERTAMLRQIVEGMAKGERWEASHYGFFALVIDVGMYDGWPHWRPVPSVAIASPLGGAEWHGMYCIDGARRVDSATEATTS